MTERTFPLKLSHDAAWFLRNRITPGPHLNITGFPTSAQEMLQDFRKKINSAILRFKDEEGLEEVEIDVGEDEAWLLDQALPFDGLDGICTQLLTQVFRGLWGLEHGIPGQLADDPRAGWNNQTFRSLR